MGGQQQQQYKENSYNNSDDGISPALKEILNDLGGTIRRSNGNINGLTKKLDEFPSLLSQSSQVTKEDFNRAINYLDKKIANNQQVLVANQQAMLNEFNQIKAQIQSLSQVAKTSAVAKPQLPSSSNNTSNPDSSKFIEIPLPKIGIVKLDYKSALIGAVLLITFLFLIIHR